MPCSIKTFSAFVGNPTAFTLFPSVTHTDSGVCAAQQSVCAWFLVRFLLFRVFIWRRCVSILEHNVLSFSVVIGRTLSLTKAKFLCCRFSAQNNWLPSEQLNMGLKYFSSLLVVVWHYISAFVIEYIRINRNLNSLRRTFFELRRFGEQKSQKTNDFKVKGKKVKKYFLRKIGK